MTRFARQTPVRVHNPTLPDFMNALPRLAATLALLALSSPLLLAQDAKPDAVPSAPAATASAPTTAAKIPESEDAAWKWVQEATQPPMPPGDWNQKKPTEEEYAAFRLKMGQSAGIAADRAREFSTRFPQSTHAKEAQDVRLQMLRAAAGLGVKDRAEELASLGGGESGGGGAGGLKLSEGPFEAKMKAAVEKALKQQENGMDAVLREFEKGVREVAREFPDRPEIYMALLEVANGVDAEHARVLAKEILDSKAPDEVKEMAAALVKKYERIGQPLNIKFTAVDGRETSIAALKGQVVLVDFWATWCGPCVAELPKVLAAYEKLHPKGFEILGISFDQDKEALEAFVKKKGMPWPQYFDGEGWKNKFGQEFGISGIPSMWLVDQKGILRDLNARDNLAAKVEKLLAEK